MGIFIFWVIQLLYSLKNFLCLTGISCLCSFSWDHLLKQLLSKMALFLRFSCNTWGHRSCFLRKLIFFCAFLIVILFRFSLYLFSNSSFQWHLDGCLGNVWVPKCLHFSLILWMCHIITVSIWLADLSCQGFFFIICLQKMGGGR